eukprot:Sspe_Gene.79756::Locus_50085_Transcript_1_1_Confidence_1.000_Length_1892::g.79756::m.79756
MGCASCPCPTRMFSLGWLWLGSGLTPGPPFSLHGVGIGPSPGGPSPGGRWTTGSGSGWKRDVLSLRYSVATLPFLRSGARRSVLSPAVIPLNWAAMGTDVPISTVSPARSRAITASSCDRTCCPFTDVSLAPALRPAASAGEEAMTLVTVSVSSMVRPIGSWEPRCTLVVLEGCRVMVGVGGSSNIPSVSCVVRCFVDFWGSRRTVGRGCRISVTRAFSTLMFRSLSIFLLRGLASMFRNMARWRASPPTKVSAGPATARFILLRLPISSSLALFTFAPSLKDLTLDTSGRGLAGGMVGLGMWAANEVQRLL